MGWIDAPSTPITRLPGGPERPALRLFDGRPRALGFLADGALVVGGSHGVTLHDPEAPTPARAAVDLGGGVRWMVVHPDGESVVVAVYRSTRPGFTVPSHGRGWDLLYPTADFARVWPASGRVVPLAEAVPLVVLRAALSPDGAHLAYVPHGEPRSLHVVEAATGAVVRVVELPSGAGESLAVRADGVVYLQGKGAMLLVHPDGRVERRDDPPFFMPPEPILVTEDGGIVGADSTRVQLVNGAFERGDRPVFQATTGTVSGDRSRVAFYGAFGQVSVWDVAAQAVTFTGATSAPVSGTMLHGSPAQGAAASGTHVAAIDPSDASVWIWRAGAPEAPIAKITGSSQGVCRIAPARGSVTVLACQSSTNDLVLDIDLEGGATRVLRRGPPPPVVHDLVRTPDGARLVLLETTGPMKPLQVVELDRDGQVVEQREVERNDGPLALSPDGRSWGVASGTESTVHAQWRPFGAAKWSKTIKAKGRLPGFALADAAAAVVVGDELVVVELAKGKPLCTVRLDARYSGRRGGFALRSDGAWVAVVCDTPRLVEVATGAVTSVPLSVESRANAVCFAGDLLFVGYESGAISRHRLPGGERTALLHGHTDKVATLSFVDGSLWSGSEDGTVLRWDGLG